MNQGADILGRWGYLGIFLSVVLGNAGLPIPEDPVHLAAGYLAASGQLDLTTALAVGILSVMAADHAGYWGSRLLGLHRGWRGRGRWNVSSRMSRALQRYGPLGVFAVRFLPGVRILTGPIAGLVGFPALQFLMAEASAAAIHVSLLVGTGHLLGARTASHALVPVVGPVLGVASGLMLWMLISLGLRRRHPTPAGEGTV